MEILSRHKTQNLRSDQEITSAVMSPEVAQGVRKNVQLFLSLWTVVMLMIGLAGCETDNNNLRKQAEAARQAAKTIGRADSRIAVVGCRGARNPLLNAFPSTRQGAQQPNGRALDARQVGRLFGHTNLRIRPGGAGFVLVRVDPSDAFSPSLGLTSGGFLGNVLDAYFVSQDARELPTDVAFSPGGSAVFSVYEQSGNVMVTPISNSGALGRTQIFGNMRGLSPRRIVSAPDGFVYVIGKNTIGRYFGDRQNGYEVFRPRTNIAMTQEGGQSVDLVDAAYIPPSETEHNSGILWVSNAGQDYFGGGRGPGQVMLFDTKVMNFGTVADRDLFGANTCVVGGVDTIRLREDAGLIHCENVLGSPNLMAASANGLVGFNSDLGPGLLFFNSGSNSSFDIDNRQPTIANLGNLTDYTASPAAQLQPLRLGRAVREMEFSSNEGRSLLAVTNNELYHFLTTGFAQFSRIRRQPLAQQLVDLAVSPDGQFGLVSSNHKKELFVLRMETAGEVSVDPLTDKIFMGGACSEVGNIAIRPRVQPYQPQSLPSAADLAELERIEQEEREEAEEAALAAAEEAEEAEEDGFDDEDDEEAVLAE